MDSFDALLHKLKENEKLNVSRCKAAGIAASLEIVSCPKCGLRESLVFWTPEGDRPEDQHYSCPRCGRGEVQNSSADHTERLTAFGR